MDRDLRTQVHRALHEFFSAAVNTLRKEDRLYRKLLHAVRLPKSRYRYDWLFHPGIAGMFETTMGYEIFKRLLALPIAKRHQVLWESPAQRHQLQRSDFVLKLGEDGRRRVDIEIVWWDRADQVGEKLREGRRGGHRYLLVLRQREGRGRPLPELLATGYGRAKRMAGMIEYDPDLHKEIATQLAGPRQVVVDIALVRVLTEKGA